MGRALPGHGMNQVMQACHPSMLEWTQEDQEFKVSITYIRSYVRPCLSETVKDF